MLGLPYRMTIELSLLACLKMCFTGLFDGDATPMPDMVCGRGNFQTLKKSRAVDLWSNVSSHWLVKVFRLALLFGFSVARRGCAVCSPRIKATCPRHRNKLA